MIAVVFSLAERDRRDGSVLILPTPSRQVRRVLDLLRPALGTTVLKHEEMPSRRSKVTV